MRLELQLKEKHLMRKNAKAEENEEQINILKDTVKNLSMQCDELKNIIRKHVPNHEEILAQPILTQAVPTFTAQTNVMKPLRGVGGSTHTSLIPRSAQVLGRTRSPRKRVRSATHAGAMNMFNALDNASPSLLSPNSTRVSFSFHSCP
jgi:hypothetical protein